MHIQIKSFLYAPFMQKYIGGTNPPIMSREFALKRINARNFFQILRGRLCGLQIVKFDEKIGSVTLAGNLNTLTKREIKRRKKKGWVLNEKNLAHYQR